MGDPELGWRVVRTGSCAGRAAVDPPRPYVAPPRRYVAPAGRARRHRRLTGLSGILLFACMFLPAVKGCHEPVMPYEVPPFLPPYVYGLVFALIAMSPSARGLRLGYTALRVLAAMFLLAGVALAIVAPPVGVVELLIGAVLLVTVDPIADKEPRIAATGVEISVASILWFGAWSTTGDALLGIYLSLACSIGLLVGCVAWLRELKRRPAVDMPRAVTVARRRE